MDWVIDTDVLVRADQLGNGHDHWLNVFRLLSSIDVMGDSLVVDHEHIIEGQYRTNLSNTGFVVKLINKFATRNRIRFVSGVLPRQISSGLRSLGFHNDDDVFVTVASRTSSGLLVAEESDYCPPIVEFLLQHSIRVFNCVIASGEVNRQSP